MQFSLDKTQKSGLFEQAREQLITALHMGRLRSGDRLPSVRQMALRNNLNSKTAFAIYQKLKDEGYIEIRTGSGAYVSDVDKLDLNQTYCLSMFQLIQANLAQASQLKIAPRQYLELVKNFIEKSQLQEIQVAVFECNQEQVNLFSSEISKHLKVQVFPVMLDKLARPDARLTRLLGRMDYFITTDYHLAQVRELGDHYRKKTIHIRLNPNFVPALIAAARRGKLLMIVSDANFFPAFRRNMISIGIAPHLLDHIIATDDQNLSRVRQLAARARSFYLSPICNPAVRQHIPEGVKEIKLDTMLAEESLEILEAVMLFHPQNPALPTL
ncbi:MAG: GntR family transcriptional regulator [Acidobacteria bacterium]|nr:GntR family transcriptional regulator [Acidobacteriota bacterium]